MIHIGKYDHGAPSAKGVIKGYITLIIVIELFKCSIRLIIVNEVFKHLSTLNIVILARLGLNT